MKSRSEEDAFLLAYYFGNLHILNCAGKQFLELTFCLVKIGAAWRDDVGLHNEIRDILSDFVTGDAPNTSD